MLKSVWKGPYENTLQRAHQKEGQEHDKTRVNEEKEESRWAASRVKEGTNCGPLAQEEGKSMVRKPNVTSHFRVFV